MLACENFVMALYNLSYVQAVERIEKDIPLMEEYAVATETKDWKFDFVEDDINTSSWYWEKFKIPMSIVSKYAQLARTVFRNEDLYARSTKTNPIFIYKFISGNIKLYRPLAEKKKKWGGNSNASDIGGFLQLPRKGVVCFISSSIKDVMVLKQHGFPAICFNGEMYGASDAKPTEKIVSTYISIVKKRFRYVFLMLDGDVAGVTAATKMASKYRIPFMDSGEVHKDISDYQAHYGVKGTFKLLKKLIRSHFKTTEQNASF